MLARKSPENIATHVSGKRERETRAFSQQVVLLCEVRLRRFRRLSRLPIDTGVRRSERLLSFVISVRRHPPGLRVGPAEIVLTPGTRCMLRNNGTGTVRTARPRF